MTMQPMPLTATLKRSLKEAVGKLPAGRDAAEGDVVVLVIGQGQALVGRATACGRATTVRDVRRWVEAAVDGLAADSDLPMAAGLSVAEASILDEAGLPEAKADDSGALERSRIEYELLLRDSLTLEQAAKDLGVTTSRLRQRLSTGVRSLFGIKEGRGWRIPRFQFQKRGQLVRNIDKVVPHIRAGAHPLAVKTWFLTPQADLPVGDDDDPATPLAWLAAGRPADVVAGLAEEI